MVDTVKIGCKIPNGIRLQLFRREDGEGPFRAMVKDGPAVILAGPSPLHTGAGATEGAGLEPGYTEVDAEWWGRWAAQNEHNLLLGEHVIFKVESE